MGCWSDDLTFKIVRNNLIFFEIVENNQHFSQIV